MFVYRNVLKVRWKQQCKFPQQITRTHYRIHSTTKWEIVDMPFNKNQIDQDQLQA